MNNLAVVANTSSHRAITQSLGIRDDDLEAKFLGCAELIRLPSTCRGEIAGLMTSQSLYQRPISECESTINQLLVSHEWRSEWLDRSLLGRMEFVVDAVQRSVKTREIAKESILQLRDQVDELLESLIQSELPSILREELALRLSNIKLCLAMYSIHGNDNLQAAIDALLGAFARAQAMKRDEKNLGALKKWGAGVLVVVHHANNLLSLARNAGEYLPALAAASASIVNVGN